MTLLNQHKKETIWYAYSGRPYVGDMPAFYEPNEFQWTRTFEKNFPAIEKELKIFIANQQDLLQPYFNTSLSDRPKAWKVGVFSMWGIKKHKHLKGVPSLKIALNDIPGYISASISVLESGAEIKPHHGDTNGIIRCHFGIDIPGQLPSCGLEVNGETRAWQNGKLMLFCDAHEHSAFNHTNAQRIVLILDIIHPYFETQKNKVVRNGLSIIWMQKIQKKLKFVSGLPGFIKGIMRYSLKAIIFVYLPIQNKCPFL